MQQDESTAQPHDGRHVVAEDLEESWLEGWTGRGLEELESYLEKHAAFLRFLEKQEP